VSVAACALISPSAPPRVQRDQTNHYGGFRNILPPGTDGTFNATDAAQFGCCNTYPPHANDQLSMYENLVYAPPGLPAAQVPSYFKDASFGVQGGQVERTYS